MGKSRRFNAPHDESCQSISTEGLAPKDARDLWCRFISQNVQLDVEELMSRRFTAAATRAFLGPAIVTRFTVSAQCVRRTELHIKSDNVDSFVLFCLREGNVQLSANGIDTVVGRRQGRLLDLRHPFVAMTDGPAMATLVAMPRHWLKAIVTEPERMVMVPLRPNNGWGRALAAEMDALVPQFFDELPLLPGRVAEQVATLLVLATGVIDRPMASSHAATLSRLRRAMIDQLGDKALDPQMVARQQGIAARTLYAIFANAGTTFCRELIRLRLDRARALLDDRRFDGRSIAEIADLAGFVDPSHFGRRFREEFGTSPGSYRRRDND